MVADPTSKRTTRVPDEVVELGLIGYLALRVERVVLNFDFYPMAVSTAHLDAGRYFFSV